MAKTPTPTFPPGDPLAALTVAQDALKSLDLRRLPGHVRQPVKDARDNVLLATRSLTGSK